MSRDEDSSPSVTIIGAGPTGLCMGYFLSKKNMPVTFLEKTRSVGGMAGSFAYTYKGQQYVLDYGPHKFYTQVDGVYDIYREIMDKKNIRTVHKKNAIRIRGKDFDFPARITQLATGLNPFVTAQIGMGVASTMTKSFFVKESVDSYEDHFIRGFGKYGYELIFKDYAKKVWGDPRKLSEELARKRVPVSSAFELLYSMLKKKDPAMSADTFLYPKQGGFGNLCTTMQEHIKHHSGLFLFDRKAEKIHWSKKGGKNHVHKVSCSSYDGKTTQEVPVDYAVSTMPIHLLPQQLHPKPPKKIVDAAKALKFRSLRIFYLFFDKKPVMKDNWRFYPEEKYVFNRVSEINSFSPQTTPNGKAVLMTEVTYTEGDKLSKTSDEKLVQRIARDLVQAGIIQGENEIVHWITRRAATVYPVYDIHFRKNLEIVLKYLTTFDNLITLGRPGLFNYNNTDHCLDMGKRAAEWLLSGSSRAGWWEMLDYFDEYTIVD